MHLAYVLSLALSPVVKMNHHQTGVFKKTVSSSCKSDNRELTSIITSQVVGRKSVNTHINQYLGYYSNIKKIWEIHVIEHLHYCIQASNSLCTQQTWSTINLCYVVNSTNTKADVTTWCGGSPNAGQRDRWLLNPTNGCYVTL